MNLDGKQVDLEKLTANAKKYVRGFLIFTAVMWAAMIGLYFPISGVFAKHFTIAHDLAMALFVIVSVVTYIALPILAIVKAHWQRSVFAFVTAYGVVVLFSSLIACLDPEIGPQPFLGFGFLGLMWTCFSLIVWMGTYHQLDLVKKMAPV